MITKDHFKPGAEKNALPALLGTNTLELSQMNIMKSKAMVVYLDNEIEINNMEGRNVFYLPARELLSRQTIRRLKRFGDTIILVSEEANVSARAWMLLSQKGIENLYISTGIEELEHFKYKFQPDTIAIARGDEFN